MKQAIRRVTRRLLAPVYDAARRLMRLHTPESRMELAAQQYWTGPAMSKPNMSHWAGEGGLEERIWRELGEQHVEMFMKFARAVEFPQTGLTIVDWGCGGGANTVSLARFANHLVGVDVTPESLQETAARLGAVSETAFTPVLIDVQTPESVLSTLPEGSVDLFFCTYVFELIPSEAYGDRILHIASRLLRAGGMAIIQVKYSGRDWRTRSRRHSYRLNVSNTTSYEIADFWERVEEFSLKASLVELVPIDRLVNDRRYAYFMLEAQ